MRIFFCFSSTSLIFFFLYVTLEVLWFSNHSLFGSDSNSSIFRNYAFSKIVFPLNFFHVNHEIDKFGSQLDRKSKTFFFLLSLMCIFPESNGTKFWSRSFYLQNSGVLQTRTDQKENPMKMNFDNFQTQKWISQTVSAQKVDEKMGSSV